MMDSIQRKDLTTESQNKKSLEIDLLSVSEILQLINEEDESVASKVYDEYAYDTRSCRGRKS